jgi:hypothetical protein
MFPLIAQGVMMLRVNLPTLYRGTISMTQLFRNVTMAALVGLLLSPCVLAQQPSLPGKWIAQEDRSFALASTDSSIPGVRFQFEQSKPLIHRGIVLGSDDNPAANAEVWFFGIFGRIPVRERTLTKPDGTYEIAIPNMDGLGQIQWGVCAIRGDESSKTLHRPATKGVKLQLNAGRKLTLRVNQQQAGKASDGQEKSIANFTVHSEDGRIVRSNGDGTCTLHGLPPRVQYIGVSAPGFAYQYWMIDLYENRDYEFTTSMAAGGVVTGTVRNQDEHAVPWNEVYGRSCESAIINLGKTFTDEQGRYELSGVRLDRKPQIHAFSHRFGNMMHSEENEVDFQGATVATSDFHVTPGRIQPPEPGVIAMLARGKERPNGLIRGKVIQPNGKPCTNFRIRVFPSAVDVGQGGYAASYESIGITYSTPDGGFIFSGLPMGSSIKLVVSAQGFREDYLDPIMPIAENELNDTEPDVFELEEASTVKLRVVDPKGEPISGAEARLYRSGPKGHVHAFLKETYVHKGKSDAQGWLEVPDVSLAFGRWVVDADKFAEQQFPWNGETESTVALENTVTIRLRFQLDGESDNKMAFMLVADDGRILQEKSDISSDEAEWVIPDLLPGQYWLSIDSPMGMYEFCFDATGKEQFRQSLEVPTGQAETFEAVYKVKPYSPKGQ